MSDKMTVGYVAQLTQPAPMATPMGWTTALDATHTPSQELDRLRAEVLALRKDALLGRFLRLHLTECHGGWVISKTFIPGAPSLEDVTDALNADMLAP